MRVIESGEKYIYEGNPKDFVSVVKNTKGPCRFYVSCSESILISRKDTSRILPMPHNVRVTKSEFIRYLSELAETIKRREEFNGDIYFVLMSVYRPGVDSSSDLTHFFI